MGLLIALQFLTSLPLPTAPAGPPAALARSLPWFPVVGLLLGLMAAALDRFLGMVVPEGVASVLVLAALLMLTGALHLDGLMDTCDGLFCAKGRDERLAIMRDSHVGSFGVAGGTIVLLAKYAALVSLPADLRLPGLVLMACLGRWAILFVAYAFPYARPEGLGKAIHDGARPASVLVGTAIATGVAAGLASATGLLLLVSVLVVAYVTGRYTAARLQGLTGDVYGAVCELSEVVVLVLLPVFSRLL